MFKGGTCLRKCYFPDYRFSEDLDFTSTNPEFALDKKTLKEIARLITKCSEIPLHIQEISPLRFNEKLTGYKATIKFWGADHSQIRHHRYRIGGRPALKSRSSCLKEWCFPSN
ncbi:nucleotidyl transferase AbiEii/AbiGii toxin family protein [Cytophaga sp. FL35]|uniref:nucleotidyl transferase AbiEii/AbiGii toxin family protein n=1 Tax=Cytophaga sp. FL35 TaxID=1904456 RepID=UPI00336A9545